MDFWGIEGVILCQHKPAKMGMPQLRGVFHVRRELNLSIRLQPQRDQPT